VVEQLPVTVSLSRDRYGELQTIVKWCRENFPEKETWRMKTWYRYQIYTFHNHSEAAMFFLKWGGRFGTDD